MDDLLACSHLVLATDDVPRLTHFFSELFGIQPHFANEMFAEFVLPSKFRIAFFKPVGTASRFFKTGPARETAGAGLTVRDVDALYARAEKNRQTWGIDLSGPPKTHPWGEKSFLLIDPDGNRWEITQTPSGDGMLTNRD